MNIDKVIQNLKTVLIMKSCQYPDSEIAKQVGLTLKEFMDVIESDSYLKEKYENAEEKLVEQIEREFLDKVLTKLDDGETGDAKWVLERRSKKYQKKDVMEINVRTVDDIIREIEEKEDER